jgi:hypothetical protein
MSALKHSWFVAKEAARAGSSQLSTGGVARLPAARAIELSAPPVPVCLASLTLSSAPAAERHLD